jgi:putative DeoR family transcriptional regulator (stage III sporulation protein D)
MTQEKILARWKGIDMLYCNKERCEVFGEYLVEHRATVRAVAAHFLISKSTVHKDITDRLRHINPGLYALVKNVLDENKSERHLRGGEATRKKYLARHRAG